MVQIVTVAANQGNGTTLGSGVWEDELYLSTNAVWDSSDLRLTFKNISQPVAPGSSYTTTNLVGLPAWAADAAYLIYRVDSYAADPRYDNVVFESDEANNTPVSVSAGVAVGGQSVQIVTVVTNQGNGTAYPPGVWEDELYLSTNAVWDSSDLLLTFRNISQLLGPGGSYTTTNLVGLPAWAAGTAYLIYRVDSYAANPTYDNLVFESNEANNTLVVPLQLVVPDLVPVSVSAAVAVTGQSVQIVALVTNQGNGTASGQGSWFDELWISTNAEWESTDVPLARPTWNQVTVHGFGKGEEKNLL